MALLKLIILLCCTYSLASEYSHHTIPIEHYETELQNLGQHVEIPETPVKVIKITKTIAVKIPVPYPVKVVEKVPYPVHVSKPYPVPVPQIVHVPAPHKPHAYAGDGHQQQGQGESYQVQESPSYGPSNGEHSFESYNGNSDHSSYGADGNDHSGAAGSSYDAPNSYYGYSGESKGSADTKSYDNAIKEYLQKVQPSGHSENSGSYNYH